MLDGTDCLVRVVPKKDADTGADEYLVAVKIAGIARILRSDYHRNELNGVFEVVKKTPSIAIEDRAAERIFQDFVASDKKAMESFTGSVIESADSYEVARRETELRRVDYESLLHEWDAANIRFAREELQSVVDRLNVKADATTLDDLRIITSGEPLRETLSRDSDVESIMAILGNGKPILLRSGYRAGTSTLLRGLAQKYGKNARSFETTGERLLRDIVANKFEGDVVQALTEWDTNLGDSNKRGFFSTSEAAVVGTFDNEAGQRLLDVLAGLENVDVVVHEQYQHERDVFTEGRFKGFQESIVAPLTLKQATTFLGEIFCDTGRRVNKEFVQALHDASGGRAFEMSYLLGKLQAEAEVDELNAEDVGRLIENIIADFSASGSANRSFLDLTYRRIKSELSGDQWEVLKNLGLGEDTELSKENLQAFTILGIIKPSRAGGYEVSGSLLRAFCQSKQ